MERTEGFFKNRLWGNGKILFISSYLLGVAPPPPSLTIYVLWPWVRDALDHLFALEACCVHSLHFQVYVYRLARVSTIFSWMLTAFGTAWCLHGSFLPLLAKGETHWCFAQSECPVVLTETTSGNVRLLEKNHWTQSCSTAHLWRGLSWLNRVR